MQPTFAAAWQGLSPAIRRRLELAHTSFAAGSLAVGAVIGPTGVIVSEGRNRAYDPPGGAGKLQGTPLAHAEMNALADIATDHELAADMLWSTQEPCSMCRAAAEFCGVGRVRFISPDPWSIAAGQGHGRGIGRRSVGRAPICCSC